MIPLNPGGRRVIVPFESQERVAKAAIGSSGGETVNCGERSLRQCVCPLLVMLGAFALTARAQPLPKVDTNEPAILGSRVPPEQGRSKTILSGEVHLIDLNTALRLAGVQNPDLLVTRQFVVEAIAERQLAAAQFLPSINAGTSYNTHGGTLQQSNGNILSVNRSSIYVGAGSLAVAGGTVQIPGVVLSGNTDELLFGYLIARQYVRRREFTAIAVRNQVFLRVCQAYCDLIRAEGRRAIAEHISSDAEQVARITAQYARFGQGRPADADRAATEWARRRANIRGEEGEILTASARLCRELNLDPSIRLHPTDALVAPLSIVPDPIPVSQLIALALTQRPEMAERRVAIREALLGLEGARLLPFSPTLLLAFSGGGYGGGSNLVQPTFGGFGGRTDTDLIAYWTLQNMGVGNLAMIHIAKANLGVKQYQELAVLDQVRDEVAEAYAKTHARYEQLIEDEQAVRSGIRGFSEDLERIKEAAEGLPIEVLNNLRLKALAEYEYLDAIVGYNRAHFELYVALGQPPSAALARPVPVGGITSPDDTPSRLPATTNGGAPAPSRPAVIAPGARVPEPVPAAPALAPVVSPFTPAPLGPVNR